MACTRLLVISGFDGALVSDVDDVCCVGHEDSLSGIRKSQHVCGASLLRGRPLRRARIMQIIFGGLTLLPRTRTKEKEIESIPYKYVQNGCT
mgnify:CR=1 FL=1